MHAIYEADEVQTPTTFVVLKKKLPPLLSPEEEEALAHSELSLFGLGVSLEDIHEKSIASCHRRKQMTAYLLVLKTLFSTSFKK